MTDEVVKAVSDMKAAIRYLREDAARYGDFGGDDVVRLRIFGAGILHSVDTTKVAMEKQICLIT